MITVRAPPYLIRAARHILSIQALHGLKQPLVDSNHRIQQSKCCALPLGEEAIWNVLESNQVPWIFSPVLNNRTSSRSANTLSGI